MIRVLILAALLASAAASARADDLSSLVDRYVAWRGGAAFEQLQSFRLRGALDTGGLHGSVDVWVDRDGRQRADTDLGVIKQVQVVTTDQSWEINPSGQVEALGRGDIQSMSREAALQFPGVLRGRGGAKAALAAPETQGGKSWDVVRISFGDDDTYDVLIDPQTGALGGFRIMEDRRGRFEGFDDWRMVDGVRMPFVQTTKTEAPGGDQAIKITSMALNGPVEAARLARPVPVRKASFANGASSTGWIDFEFYEGDRIFFPVAVNGHKVIALLDSGATVSAIDRPFAAAIGLKSKGDITAAGTGGIDTMGFVGPVVVQIGDLTLRDVNAGTFDLAPVAKRMGHPMPFVLGDEAFNELAIDIDFAHRRLAFRDPAGLAKPAGAVEIPLSRVSGNRSVPVSVEGAAPVQFEFDLGNGGPLQIFPAYYQPHKLLDGRRVSQTFAGAIGGFHPWTIGTLDHVDFAGVDFGRTPSVFTPDVMSASNSNLDVGNIGMPILARFRLVIDYSRDRLYATPYADAASRPFARDRLGLFLDKQDTGLSVQFVSPGSPAAAAGFKTGDLVALIDGKPASAWSGAALASLRFAPAGTRHVFTLRDGAVRRVRMAEFF